MRSELQKRNNLGNVFYFGKDDRYVRWADCESIEKSYWADVLKYIASPFEIIVTENSKYLPKYGNDIIVILKSDEFASDIKYSIRVKAVFRNYFDKKYVRDKNIFFLPLPYLGRITGISNIPVLNRRIDVFFAGQVVYQERNELSKILLALKDRRKDLEIVFEKTHEFFSGWNANHYFKKLGNSKISLCPRGASAEAYRHFESLRKGCVVISKPLPDVWYFKDAPIQIIQQWQELPILLNKFLGDESLLEKISKKSIDYWSNKLSPKAVAKFIVDSLSHLS